MRSPSDATARARTPLWVWPLLIALLLVMAVALPVIAIALAVRLAAAAALLATVWLTWCTRGRYALVVYSNSPIWQEYFETHVLAALGSRGVVLNWSERRRWRLSLPVVLFRFFAGGREFNPWAIVFAPFARPRHFRFYRPFRAFKYGRPDEVDQLRGEFFALLDALAPPRANR
jgi:hypothetical protein